jgi:hypothetical protein
MRLLFSMERVSLGSNWEAMSLMTSKCAKKVRHARGEDAQEHRGEVGDRIFLLEQAPLEERGYPPA